jgi:hypothetical protein
MKDTNQPNYTEKTAKQEAGAIYDDKGTRWGVAKVPVHTHNGVDTNQIPFDNLSQKKVYVHWTLPGSSAATAANYGVFWIAPVACTVIGFAEVHEVAGTAGGTVSLQLERLQGTEAPGSGDELLASALSLKSTANTVQYGNIKLTRSAGRALANLAAGDRLCLKDSGTLTSLSNVTVLVTVMY